MSMSGLTGFIFIYFFKGGGGGVCGPRGDR